MGTFRWPMRIAGIDGRQTRDLEAIVDTGAIYTALPAHLLHGLGSRRPASADSLWPTGGGSRWNTARLG